MKMLLRWLVKSWKSLTGFLPSKKWERTSGSFRSGGCFVIQSEPVESRPQLPPEAAAVIQAAEEQFRSMKVFSNLPPGVRVTAEVRESGRAGDRRHLLAVLSRPS